MSDIRRPLAGMVVAFALILVANTIVTRASFFLMAGGIMLYLVCVGWFMLQVTEGRNKR